MPKRYDLRYDRLNTISKGGRKENFWNYVERATGKRSLTRFLRQGMILTFLSIFLTVVGSVLRGIAYKAILGGVGSNCFIEKNVEFNVPQRIFLGDRVLIGCGSILDVGSVESKIQLKDDVRISRYCTLRAGPGNIYINGQVNIGTYSHIDGHGDIEIGKNSLISRNVEIITGNHIFKDPGVPIKFQGTKLKKVQIGEDVWLGAYVIVLPGVTIGNGAVVGAGAVVKNDIPPYSVAVGNPAKVIRKRE